MKKHRIGIDIGSTSAKCAVLNDQNELVFTSVVPTGWSGADAAERLAADLERNGFSLEEAVCAATGYGRVSVPFATKTLTEITCHAAGAAWIHDADSLLVIDIGGQDTKIIRVRNRRAADFLMNDKCSAGTGRFLEIMGNAMGLAPEELCELARKGDGPPISTTCTVFAESEVVSLVGRGEKKENIAHSIVESIAEKVASQAARLAEPADRFCLTGGLCDCPYLRESLEAKIGAPVLADVKGRHAGAIGAALSVV